MSISCLLVRRVFLFESRVLFWASWRDIFEFLNQLFVHFKLISEHTYGFRVAHILYVQSFLFLLLLVLRNRQLEMVLQPLSRILQHFTDHSLLTAKGDLVVILPRSFSRHTIEDALRVYDTACQSEANASVMQ